LLDLDPVEGGAFYSIQALGQPFLKLNFKAGKSAFEPCLALVACLEEGAFYPFKRAGQQLFDLIFKAII
jgi:hypothetical protein